MCHRPDFQMFYKYFHLLECLRFHKVNSWNFIRNASTGKKHFKVNKFDRQNAYSVPNDKPSSRLKQHDYIYLSDSFGADIIAHHVCENWRDGYVFEVNPGHGILSKALLKAGVPHLRVFEKNKAFVAELKKLTKQHSNFEFIEEDFLFLPSLEARTYDEDSARCLEGFFDGIPKLSSEKSKDWEKDILSLQDQFIQEVVLRTSQGGINSMRKTGLTLGSQATEDNDLKIN